LLHKPFPLLQLLAHQQPPVPRTEAGVIAVDAPANAHSAITIGAGETGVDGDLVDTAAERLAQMVCKAPVTLAGRNRGV
jgi:hypothetical protein